MFLKQLTVITILAFDRRGWKVDWLKKFWFLKGNSILNGFDKMIRHRESDKTVSGWDDLENSN